MPPRTVLHGIDQSSPTFRDLPDKGHHNTICLQEDLQCTWMYDIETGNWRPYEYLAFEYDFAEDGGSIGFHNLDVEVPANTMVWDGVLDVVDTFLSGGAATISIKMENTDDILVAAGIGVVGTVGLHDIVPDGTAANAIRTTVAQQIKMDIRVSGLTAGKLYGFLRCFRGFGLEEQSSSSSVSSSSNSSSSSSSASVSSSSSQSVSSSSSQSSPSSSSSSTAQTSSSSSSKSQSSPSSSSSSTAQTSSSSSSKSTSSSSTAQTSSSSSTAQTSSSSSTEQTSSSSTKSSSSVSSPSSSSVSSSTAATSASSASTSSVSSSSPSSSSGSTSSASSTSAQTTF